MIWELKKTLWLLPWNHQTLDSILRPPHERFIQIGTDRHEFSGVGYKRTCECSMPKVSPIQHHGVVKIIPHVNPDTCGTFVILANSAATLSYFSSNIMGRFHPTRMLRAKMNDNYKRLVKINPQISSLLLNALIFIK